jgi:hypothetical protein
VTRRLKATLVGVLAFLSVMLGCATTTAYEGHPNERPSIHVTTLRHLVTRDPRFPAQVERITIATVTNPTDQPVQLDCNPDTLQTIQPHTTAKVLLTPRGPRDRSCVIR